MHGSPETVCEPVIEILDAGARIDGVRYETDFEVALHLVGTGATSWRISRGDGVDAAPAGYRTDHRTDIGRILKNFPFARELVSLRRASCEKG